MSVIVNHILRYDITNNMRDIHCPTITIFIRVVDIVLLKSVKLKTILFSRYKLIGEILYL